MSKDLTKLIESTEKGEINLISPTIEILRKINGKTFKYLFENEIGVLEELRQVARFTKDNKQFNMALFTNEEIIEAGTKADTYWYPVRIGKKIEWFDQITPQVRTMLKAN